MVGGDWLLLRLCAGPCWIRASSFEFMQAPAHGTGTVCGVLIEFDYWSMVSAYSPVRIKIFGDVSDFQICHQGTPYWLLEQSSPYTPVEYDM